MPKKISITLHNIGELKDTITFKSDNSLYSVSPLKATILPKKDLKVDIIFTPRDTSTVYLIYLFIYRVIVRLIFVGVIPIKFH